MIIGTVRRIQDSILNLFPEIVRKFENEKCLAHKKVQWDLEWFLQHSGKPQDLN